MKSQLKVPAIIKRAHRMASQTQARAYAPYSRFKVGSAVIAKNRIFAGCNVENASYGGTICAERNAIFHAVSEGVREFDHVLIVSQSAQPAPPCGMCRQVMAEFCGPNTLVWLASRSRILEVHLFSSLLPFPFGPGYL